MVPPTNDSMVPAVVRNISTTNKSVQTTGQVTRADANQLIYEGSNEAINDIAVLQENMLWITISIRTVPTTILIAMIQVSHA